MGLDMFLKGKMYVPYNERNSTASKLDVEYEVSVIELELAYWRKVNSIHNWFVNNVQDGVDDCSEFYVNPPKLVELRDLCKKALETKDSSLLPPTSGFFFGSTEIDDWYWADIQETYDRLNKIIDDPLIVGNQSRVDVYYRASW